jgi:hypothetical protein
MSRPSFQTFTGPTLLLLLLAAGPARAEEAVAAAPAAAAAAEAPKETATPVERSPAERSSDDTPAPAPALDTTWRDALAPSSSSRAAKRWSTSAEVDSNTYRLSLSRGKLDMGLGFDTVPQSTTTTAARSTDPSRPIVPALPSLSVGLRSTTAGPPPNSLIERATDVQTPATSTKRVGLEWKPVQSRVFVRGGLGLRLSGDDQVTMKLRSGRVGLYMKSTF